MSFLLTGIVIKRKRCVFAGNNSSELLALLILFHLMKVVVGTEIRYEIIMNWNRINWYLKLL